MKRHAVFLLLLLCAPYTCRSQMIRGWGVEGGAVGGYQFLSITSATSSPVIPRAVRWGFSAGAFIEFLNMPTLSLVLESAYSQEGRKVTAQEVAEASNQTAGLSPGPVGSTRPRGCRSHPGPDHLCRNATLDERNCLEASRLG